MKEYKKPEIAMVKFDSENILVESSLGTGIDATIAFEELGIDNFDTE